MYATSDIYEAGRYLLSRAEIVDNVKIMAITVYDLEPWDPEQLSIFDAEQGRREKQEVGSKARVVQIEYRSQEATRRLSDAMDAVICATGSS